ncbi:MAG TPA: 16S rRNA (adenine(1518)-N(6)/adenine(1519)-N(6))-dimethyltransferase RsmA [Candidatus Saccharimonadales bacterium]|nr:16S rRNA (adenine(1518)-N(6)/adenine(1519)-N(6))-dimethyltransferase RsmA [Candidatus Saccharimonadales bacterium]
MIDQPAAKKSLGQHWLEDPVSLAAMLVAADVQPDDTVLEIGPGLGSLTSLLVEAADQVIAVELDDVLVAKLPKAVPATNLQIVHQSILEFDFTNLPPNYKIVANIPYYLTSHLLRNLSQTPNPAAQAALLMQKEVAERAAAGPGAMSLLSVSLQFYWEVSLGRLVPAELFSPPPKVDSQILRLVRRDEPLFTDVDEKQFFRLVRLGFAQRRKTILNSLGSGLHLSRQEITACCMEAGIEPTARAQILSLQEWHQLYLVLNT